MGRLTNSINYCDTHCDFGKRGECFFKDKSKCYENNMFEKLRAYEDIIDDPEKLKLIDALYLERCEEINRLKAELTKARNKTIEEFRSEAINFEDYIEPINESPCGAILMYSGYDITKMIMKISEKLKGVQDVN